MHKILPSKALPSVPWQARHADSDYRDRLEEITCPTLITWGENDSVVAVDDAHEYERLISDSRKTVMEDTGHVPMMERPRAVNDVLLEFLTESGPAEERETVDAVSERR